MSVYNSYRSFKVMSFFLNEKSSINGIELPNGFITVRLDPELPVYHFSNFVENSHGIFVENKLGSTPVISACSMFKVIQGSNYKENEDFTNEV